MEIEAAVQSFVSTSTVVETSQLSQHSISNSIDISTETNNAVSEDKYKIRKKIVPMY
jgi:hypothetical protein